jgi:hypothetical protein
MMTTHGEFQPCSSKSKPERNEEAERKREDKRVVEII